MPASLEVRYEMVGENNVGGPVAGGLWGVGVKGTGITRRQLGTDSVGFGVF